MARTKTKKNKKGGGYTTTFNFLNGVHLLESIRIPDIRSALFRLPQEHLFRGGSKKKKRMKRTKRNKPNKRK